MDINSYSYAPHMLEEKGNIQENFYSDNGYGYISLEQWGCDSNTLQYVVFIASYSGATPDICQTFTADNSQGWQTLRPAYEQAARFYNEYAPEPIPLF